MTAFPRTHPLQLTKAQRKALLAAISAAWNTSTPDATMIFDAVHALILAGEDPPSIRQRLNPPARRREQTR